MQGEVSIPRALVVSWRRRYEHEVGGPSLQDLRMLMHFIKCGADDTDRLHTGVLALNTPHFTRRSKISTHILYIAQ